MTPGLKRFLQGLLPSVIFGVVIFLVIQAAERNEGSREAIALSVRLLTGILSALFAFFFITWLNEYQEWKKSVDVFVERLKLGNPYEPLIRRQLELHWQLSSVFRELLDTYARTPGSAIVISANSDAYLVRLTQCLRNARQSFEAIMRGGNMELYRPSWFFKDPHGNWSTDAAGNKAIFSPKKQYLDEVARAKCAKKVRIWIFSKPTVLADFDDSHVRELFLEAVTRGGVRNYWLDAEEVKALLPRAEYEDFRRPWEEYFEHDFAIIDTLVIKHTTQNGNLLFISIADQILPYRFLFEQLDHYLQNLSHARFSFYEIKRDSIIRHGVKSSWQNWLSAQRNTFPVPPAPAAAPPTPGPATPAAPAAAAPAPAVSKDNLPSGEPANLETHQQKQ